MLVATGEFKQASHGSKKILKCANNFVWNIFGVCLKLGQISLFNDFLEGKSEVPTLSSINVYTDLLWTRV